MLVNFLDWVVARLSEPSSMAGIALLIEHFGFGQPVAMSVSNIVITAIGLLAVVMHEKAPA
jgi:hypothetical protein